MGKIRDLQTIKDWIEDNCVEFGESDSAERLVERIKRAGEHALSLYGMRETALALKHSLLGKDVVETV